MPYLSSDVDDFTSDVGVGDLSPSSLPRRKRSSGSRSVSATGEVVISHTSLNSIREELTQQSAIRNDERSHRSEEKRDEALMQEKQSKRKQNNGAITEATKKSRSPKRSPAHVESRPISDSLHLQKAKMFGSNDLIALSPNQRRSNASHEASSVKSSSSHHKVSKGTRTTRGNRTRSLSPTRRHVGSEDLREAKQVAKSLTSSTSHHKRKDHHTSTKGKNHRSLLSSPSHAHPNRRPASSEDLRKAKEVANSLRSSSSHDKRRNHKSPRASSPHHRRPASSEDLRKAKEVANSLRSSSSHHHKSRKGKNHRSLSPHHRRPASSEDLRKAKDIANSLRSSSSHHHKKRKHHTGTRTSKENHYQLWSLPPNQQHRHQPASPEQLRRAKEVANGLRSPTSLNDNKRNELLENRSKARKNRNKSPALSISLHRDQTARRTKLAESRRHRSLSPSRRRAEPEFHISGNASESTEEEEMPGAYRVSSHTARRIEATQPSLQSEDGHSFVEPDEESGADSTRSFASGSTSHASPTSNGDTLVNAEIARDMADEIEAAREQGRAEALEQVSHQDHNIVVASVVQKSRQESDEDDSWRMSKKPLLLFGSFLCLIVITGVVLYFTVFNQEESELTTAGTIAPNMDDAQLNATFRYDPPTAEDCASIANGTDVVGQEDMFSLFVDMHIQIASESEEDTVFLVELLQKQIQSRLIPLLVGCDESDGNLIGNGNVDSARSNETSGCLFPNNPLCLEVVFTLKIFLRREEYGTSVLEILSEIVYEEDLNETLDLPPTVQTAGVSKIVIHPDISSEVPSETPSWSPSSSPFVTLSASPSVEPSSLQLPTIDTPTPTSDVKTLQTPNPTVGSPSPPVYTLAPVLGSQNDDEVSLPILSVAPSSMPSTKTPSVAPSSSPSESPSTFPSTAPSKSPSFNPTRAPSRSPSSAPSASPTSSPSTQPTTSSPSSFPTKPPSFAPSKTPSLSPAPTITPQPSPSPTISSQPSVSGYYWVACGSASANNCNGRAASVQNANHEFVGGIVSALDEDMIAVRCCSDTYLENFHDPRSQSCPYARSNVAGCINTATFYEAETACRSVGARLCTLEEIQNNCASRSGCGHNARMAWTSTQGSP